MIGRQHGQLATVFYKGVSLDTMQKIKKSNIIKGRVVKKAGRVFMGVYLSKSPKVAQAYGDYVLIIDGTGLYIVKSPHSNQFIAIGDISASKIIKSVRVEKDGEDFE